MDPCERCSKRNRKVFHTSAECPRERMSRYGWHTEQIEGMEKDLMDAPDRDVTETVRKWTW